MGREVLERDAELSVLAGAVQAAAHGITDAQLLVRAVTSRELGSYQAERDELSLRLFRVTGRIASFSWTADGIGELLALTLADEVTRR